MKRFTVVMSIYNLAMKFWVTQISSKPDRFIIETGANESSGTILKLLPRNKWIAEHVSMKYFTKENIKKLGSLIVHQKLTLSSIK